MNLFLSFSIVFAASLAQAISVTSQDTKVNLARVVDLTVFEAKTEVSSSVAVVDHGGSTDMSPTQSIYLTLYRKGEMFSTDATFEIANVFSVQSVKRAQFGIYKVIVQNERLENVTYSIDARRAISDIKKVNCGDEFDCKASEDFASTVEVRSK